MKKLPVEKASSDSLTDVDVLLSGLRSSMEIIETDAGRMARSIYTTIRTNGEVDLVAIVHQSLPSSERRARAFLADQDMQLNRAFIANEGMLDLKEALRPMTQAEVAELALSHLRSSEVWLVPSRGKTLSEESLVSKTATLWRLLKQFGSSRPAEVLAEYFNAKPRAINARLKSAREKGLIPPVERQSPASHKTDA